MLQACIYHTSVSNVIDNIGILNCNINIYILRGFHGEKRAEVFDFL